MSDTTYTDFQLREAWESEDKERTGTLSTSSIRAVLLKLVKNISEEEIADWIEELDPDITGYSTYQIFHWCITRRRCSIDDEIKEAFKYFDKDGTNAIPTAELRQIMLSIGENLTDEEVDEMIRESQAEQNGQTNYVKFVTTLLTHKH